MKKHKDPMTKKPVVSGEHMPGAKGGAPAANSTSGNPAAIRKPGKKAKTITHAAKMPKRVARY